MKELRPAYGFDEVAIVPGDVTINPEQVDTSFKLGTYTFPFPILAAAMDAVVDPKFAVLFSKLGGLPMLNLEGIYFRYDDPQEPLQAIINAPDDEAIAILQKIYSEPVKERLIEDRVGEVKRAGAICAVATTPASARMLLPPSLRAGADIIVIQSTVTTARHISRSPQMLDLSELRRHFRQPILVGNCVSYSAALELMRTGIEGVLVGVGPGAACTTREVLGVGVPQVSAIMEVASARESYFKESGRYVLVIADGGIQKSGDLCKAIACGADAVVLGSLLVQAIEAPGQGYNWGMSTPHSTLPRGTRINVGVKAELEQILFGPSSVTDGTQNLVGALRMAMGMCGASNLKEFQKATLVLAPSIKTEGKSIQLLTKSA